MSEMARHPLGTVVSRAEDARRRTILYLIETGGHGGAEQNLVQLSSGLTPDRYCPSVRLVRGGWLHEQLSLLGVPVSLLRMRNLPLRLSLPLIAELAYLIRRNRVALVHSYMFAMGLHGSMAALLCGVPAVFGVRGQGYEVATRRRRVICRTLARLGCHFTAVTSDIAGSLAAECGVPACQITCIPNGVDAAVYLPTRDRAAVRTSLGLAASLTTVGTVARLEQVKGVATLIDSIPLLEHALGPVQVVIAGDGSKRAELGRLAACRRGNSKVVFLGTRDDIPQVLAALDLFVLPSLSEGMSNALLQAMAAQLPCVATAVGGNPEVIEHGRTGWLVPPGDVVSLADAVSYLLKSPELRRGIAESARSEVEKRYDIRLMVARNEELYSALISRREAPSGSSELTGERYSDAPAQSDLERHEPTSSLMANTCCPTSLPAPRRGSARSRRPESAAR